MTDARNLAQANEPTLAEIVTALRDVYDDRGCVIWLRASHFDRAFSSGNTAGGMPPPTSKTALDLIAQGRTAEVMQAIGQLQSGAAT